MTTTQPPHKMSAEDSAGQIAVNQRFALLLALSALIAALGMAIAISFDVWAAAVTTALQMVANGGDELLNQVGILVTGPFAIWLTHDTRATWRKWACIFGLAGQPFWLISTYDAAQWGMFINSVLFTGAWLRGFHQAWVKEWLQRKFSALNKGVAR